MATAQPFPQPLDRRGLFDRLLSLFSPVGAGEGLGAIILALNVFTLLGTYYVVKTVREPLILGQPGGAEVKSMASAGQALLFLLAVPVYGAIASRFNRVGLVGGVTAFFASNLLIFSALGSAGVPIGVPFFLWVGIFNMLVVAQFWAFANDLYTEEQGKRLFPIVGVGASLGAWVGATAAKWLFGAMGPYQLMMLSAILLCVCILLTLISHRREAGRTQRADAAQPLDKKGGFRMIFQQRYLLLIAMLVLLFNCVNSVGEYIVSRFVSEQAQSLPEAQRGSFIGQFYGDYFAWVNLLGFLIQTFLVSRLFQWIGIRGALFVLPVIALGSYSILAALPVLAVIRVAKIFENATDYSLNNTVRHALFLPTSREAKYKAKAATDTFFVRTGDMVQAGIVALGTQVFSWSVTNFAVVNLVLISVWIALAVGIFREHKRLSSTS
jgi:AAA family ATP:ADP antiporter